MTWQCFPAEFAESQIPRYGDRGQLAAISLPRAYREQMVATANVEHAAGNGRAGHHGFADVIFAEQTVFRSLGEHESVAVLIGDVEPVRPGHRRTGKSGRSTETLLIQPFATRQLVGGEHTVVKTEIANFFVEQRRLHVI